MAEIKILIRSTDVGLETDYISLGFDLGSDKSRAYEDDRFKVSSNSSVFTFSFQNLNNYVSYSLLALKRDHVERKGAYEIKLFCPKNKRINNFVDLLLKLNDTYLVHSQNNSLARANFDAILNKFTCFESFYCYNTDKRKYFINYSTYDEVQNICNNVKIGAINKVYFFGHNYKPTSTDLLDYNTEKDKFYSLKVNNKNLALTSFKIDDINLASVLRLSYFIIYYTPNQKLSYQRKGKDFFESVRSSGMSDLEINSYFESSQSAPQQEGGVRPKKKGGGGAERGMILGLIGIVFVVVISISYDHIIEFFSAPQKRVTVTDTIVKVNPPADTTMSVTKYSISDSIKRYNKFLYFLVKDGVVDSNFVFYKSSNDILINEKYKNDYELKKYSQKININQHLKFMEKSDRQDFIDMLNGSISELRSNSTVGKDIDPKKDPKKDPKEDPKKDPKKDPQVVTDPYAPPK